MITPVISATLPTFQLAEDRQRSPEPTAPRLNVTESGVPETYLNLDDSNSEDGGATQYILAPRTFTPIPSPPVPSQEPKPPLEEEVKLALEKWLSVTLGHSSLEMVKPQNGNDGYWRSRKPVFSVDLNTPSTDLRENSFISSSIEDNVGEDPESLHTHTIQEYSTDSGYSSLQSQHSTIVTGGHKTTQAQIHIELPTSIKEEVDEDTHSNMSVDDVASYTSSSNDSFIDQEIKETAQSLILQTIEQDEILNPLFKDALKRYGRTRVVRNITGFLKGYCNLLGRKQPSIHQKRGIIFLRHRARHFAALICENLDPSRIGADKALALERARNSAAERNFRLAHWITGNARSLSSARSSNQSDHEDESEPESLASSAGLPPILDDIRNFLVVGEPLQLFRQHFAQFVAGESIREWNTITKRNRGSTIQLPMVNLPLEEQLSSVAFMDPIMQGSVSFISEKNSFQVSWKCVSSINTSLISILT